MTDAGSERLAASLSRSLGDAELARAVHRWMARAGADHGRLEASVRGGWDLRAPSRRMMIEGIAARDVDGFLEALGVSSSEVCRRLVATAQTHGLPTIVGWDRTHGPVVKLYLNASDASAPVRAAVSGALGLPTAAHVVGFNVDARGKTEVKVYQQSRTPPDGTPLAHFAPFLLADLGAGWVTSHDVEGTALRPRAVFLAIKTGHHATEGTLRALGWWEKLRAAAPFEPGGLRSVGVDLRGHGAHTLYFKPADAPVEGWTLEPALVASMPGGEVGLFVEPATPGRRAWAVIGPHALSYRVRGGAPDREPLHALLRWAELALARGIAPEALVDDSAVPEPWRVQLP